MKSLSFWIVALNLVSSLASASMVGAYKTKACTLIVPRTTPEYVVKILVEKGYRPVNTVGVLTHDLKKEFNGSFESRASKELHDTPDLVGYPYLEIKEDSLPGVRFGGLSIGVAGARLMPKYNSNKTTFVNQGSQNSLYSAEQLPNCIETPEDKN